MAQPLRRAAGNNNNASVQEKKLVPIHYGGTCASAGMQDVTPDRDWLLEVATALQTTLDLDVLISVFSEHAGRVVPHDGVRYENHAEKSCIVAGAPDARNSMSYDLVLVNHKLGRLTFLRDMPFDPRETIALENILCNLMHPLRNALMYREALGAAARDPLTGMNNRANLDSALDREVELARRHGTTLSVVMIDADRFKQINDTHGHPVGDAVLRLLAQGIRACIRDSDIAFRYGGEEFVLVLSNTGAEGAVNLAERIRHSVEDAALEVESAEVAVTVSLGVATLEPEDDAESLLARSDQALYRSKRAGRNRVTVLHARASAAPVREGRVAARGSGGQG